MVLRLGEGRDLATRKKAGEHIFKALSAYLDPVFANSKFALSFDMQINDKETSWKRNNIHDALKVEAAQWIRSRRKMCFRPIATAPRRCSSQTEGRRHRPHDRRQDRAVDLGRDV